MNLVTGLGIPYMGGKRKLAPKIMEYIMFNNPNCKYFYDLFGGGGAMSFMALQYPQIQQVYYNELNTGVVELFRKIQKDGVVDEMFQWIDRETFMKHKNDNDWFGGLCKTVWSFGNNQRTYLFGKDIEGIKREAHEYLMANGYNKTASTRVNLINKFKQDKTIIGRFGRFKLEQLERLQRLQQLQQLERLQQLEQLQQLEISNLSYEQVNITTPINETIIYLDPPYKNTGKYQHCIDHNVLLDYIKNSPYKIYVSSYEFDGLNEVFSMKHRSTLSVSVNNCVEEKLFCNRNETNNVDFKNSHDVQMFKLFC